MTSIHPRSAHTAPLRADYGTHAPVPLGFYGGELRRWSESTRLSHSRLDSSMPPRPPPLPHLSSSTSSSPPPHMVCSGTRRRRRSHSSNANQPPSATLRALHSDLLSLCRKHQAASRGRMVVVATTEVERGKRFCRVVVLRGRASASLGPYPDLGDGIVVTARGSD